MQQEGVIILGTGDDDRNGSVGPFFEGVVMRIVELLTIRG